MYDYSLIKSFGIDDGELDNCSKEQCFVLGYELAHIDALLLDFEPFSRPVHVENKSRIEKWLTEADRDFKLSWMKDDSSETWMWLEVK